MFNPDTWVRPNIKALQPYSSARDEFSGLEGIFLDANENPFGTLNRYPDPYQQVLKKRISSLKNIPVENIFLGNGSDEIIDLLIRIFCNPGRDKIAILPPTYGMYAVSAGINDVQILNAPLTADFQTDWNKLEPVLQEENLKIIFLCSPNNPTGNCLNGKDIEAILKKFAGVVVIDEAYIDFATEASWTKRLEEYPNLVVMQTFSKAWGLAAARAGMAFTSAAIIAYLNKVKPPYNMSGPDQSAVFQALDQQAEMVKNLRILLTEKEKMKAALATIPAVKKIYASDANFWLFEVPDANKVYAELVNRKIIARNRNSVVRNCIRVTVGSPEENTAFIKALTEIVS